MVVPLAHKRLLPFLRACLMIMLFSGLTGCLNVNKHIEITASKSGLDERLNLVLHTPESTLQTRVTQVLETPEQPPELVNADCLPEKRKEVELYWEHVYALPKGYYSYNFLDLVAVGWTFPVSIIQLHNRKTPETKPCTLWFILKEGLVESFRYEGPGCERVAPRKAL